MSSIWREPVDFDVNVGTTLETSTAIEVKYMAGGSIQFPAASGTTEITVYGQLRNLSYGIALDHLNQPLVISITPGQPKALPIALYHFPNVKFVATGGTATANVPVFLKS